MTVPLLSHIYAGGATTRFHTMNMHKDDNVAQHSFGVAWLVYILTGGRASSTLIMAALAHDLAEHSTGDIPAPTKRNLNIGPQFREYERAIEMSTCTHFELTKVEERTLKLADCMDGLMRCAIEINMGNRFVYTAYDNFLSYITDLGVTPEENSVLAQIVETVRGHK